MAKNRANTAKQPKKSFLDWIKDNRTFFVALCVIVLLMIVAFVLSQVLPAGKFVENPESKFGYDFVIIKNNFPFWKFLLSPFLLFGPETNGGKSVAIIVSFLFVISGVMEVMTKSNVLTYVFDRIVEKFKNHRHLLLIILVVFFMAVGSLIGCYDEIVPFVPLLIILVAKFGYDKYMGMSVSLFAIAAGFAAGIFNPFIVAIPQEIAEVDQFSGMWMRIVLFFVLLVATCTYVLLKARKCDHANPSKIKIDNSSSAKTNPTLGKAGIAFGSSVLLGFIMVILILFVPALKETVGSYSLLFLAACFLLGGILTAAITKMPPKDFIRNFTKGIKSTLMAGILLVLASSISYTLEVSERMPTILYGFVKLTYGISPLAYIFIFYFLFLLFSLFIASGSAKALLLIPILAPIAETYDILYPMFLAFALADGMADLACPTNPILIVVLNITETNYGEYIKKNWAYLLSFFLISVLMLCFSYAVGYNASPF